MKGATHVTESPFAGLVVSIHAPNEGSDGIYRWVAKPGQVSIHAPNEGSDVHRDADFRTR